MLRLLATVQAQFVSHCTHIATHRERNFTFSGRNTNQRTSDLEIDELQSKIRGGGDRRGRVQGRAPTGERPGAAGLDAPGRPVAALGLRAL
jgi:hypothetical protein